MKSYSLVTVMLFASLFLVNVLPLLAEPLVKIGIISDFTGKAAYLGTQTRRGAEIAIREMQAEGKKVEGIFGDNSFVPTKAVSEAQKMLSFDKVDALYTNFTPIARALSPVAQGAGKLFVYTAAAVSPAANNPLAFKSYLDYTRGCRAVAGYWKKRGLARIAVLKPESEFGELCVRGVKEIYGDVLIVAYNMGEDVRTQVLMLKSKKAQAVLNAAYESDLVNMLKALSQLKFNPQLATEESALTAAVRLEYEDALEGIIFYGMPTPPADFIAKLESHTPGGASAGGEHAAMGYLHVKQIYTAIRACGERGAVCQAAELKASPGEDSFGFERWDENRTAVYRWALRQIRNGRVIEISSSFGPRPQ